MLLDSVETNTCLVYNTEFFIFATIFFTCFCDIVNNPKHFMRFQTMFPLTVLKTFLKIIFSRGNLGMICPFSIKVA